MPGKPADSDAGLSSTKLLCSTNDVTKTALIVESVFKLPTLRAADSTTPSEPLTASAILVDAVATVLAASPAVDDVIGASVSDPLSAVLGAAAGDNAEPSGSIAAGTVDLSAIKSVGSMIALCRPSSR